MRIPGEALADGRFPEPFRDLLPGDIGVREDTDAAGRTVPIAGQDRELGYDERRLAAAGTGGDIEGARRKQELTSRVIEGPQIQEITGPANIVVVDWPGQR